MRHFYPELKRNSFSLQSFCISWHLAVRLVTKFYSVWISRGSSWSLTANLGPSLCESCLYCGIWSARLTSCHWFYCFLLAALHYNVTQIRSNLHPTPNKVLSWINQSNIKRSCFEWLVISITDEQNMWKPMHRICL